jgi:hypothetical protein
MILPKIEKKIEKVILIITERFYPEEFGLCGFLERLTPIHHE